MPCQFSCAEYSGEMLQVFASLQKFSLQTFATVYFICAEGFTGSRTAAINHVVHIGESTTEALPLMLPFLRERSSYPL